MQEASAPRAEAPCCIMCSTAAGPEPATLGLRYVLSLAHSRIRGGKNAIRVEVGARRPAETEISKRSRNPGKWVSRRSHTSIVWLRESVCAAPADNRPAISVALASAPPRALLRRALAAKVA